MPGARSAVAIALAVTFGLGGCAGDPGAARREACRDLGHLAPTIRLVLAPPPATTVGELRDAFEKAAPTIRSAGSLPGVPHEVALALEEATDEIADGLDGIGDDESADRVADRLAEPRRRLAAALAEARSALACAAGGSG